MNRGMFTSNTGNWATPQKLFDKLDAEFHFERDVCASKTNAKCRKYFDENDDALSLPWTGVCWCNPPYGRKIGLWITKARDAALSGATVVCLLPARTDTRWFYDLCLVSGEIRFLPGRLYFNDGPDRAPFPSMIVIFRAAGSNS